MCVQGQGIKYVLVKVITNPRRKWVTAAWFPKLLGLAIKSNTVKKMTVSDLCMHGKDAQG